MVTFEDAVRRYGKPERLRHDRGCAFWSWRDDLTRDFDDDGSDWRRLRMRSPLREHARQLVVLIAS